jgi:hypothetical protein
MSQPLMPLPPYQPMPLAIPQFAPIMVQQLAPATQQNQQPVQQQRLGISFHCLLHVHFYSFIFYRYLQIQQSRQQMQLQRGCLTDYPMIHRFNSPILSRFIQHIYEPIFAVHLVQYQEQLFFAVCQTSRKQRGHSRRTGMEGPQGRWIGPCIIIFVSIQITSSL